MKLFSNVVNNPKIKCVKVIVRGGIHNNRIKNSLVDNTTNNNATASCWQQNYKLNEFKGKMKKSEFINKLS